LLGPKNSSILCVVLQTYVFKLMNSSGVTESGESEKVLLLMESGVRLHTTAYLRDKSNTPSGFTLKLRKHIRTRRLEDVRQLGYDRIILFQFGLGANMHYVILELYAQGNIILTDPEFMVLTLLRSHSHKIGKSNESSKTSDGSRAKQATLKVVLGEVLGYGPALSEHIILDAGLAPNVKLVKDFNLEDSAILALVEAVKKFEDWLEDIISGDKVPEGYILMQQKILGKECMPQIYDEFCPLLLNQFKSRDSIKFETFDAALDEFYSKIESQRSEQQQKAKENSAVQKLSKVRTDQENRVYALKREVYNSVKMAELIEYNLEDVDAAILAVRLALANGMSWEDLVRMVKEERKSGNPVAGLIDKLHLERNCMTLLLSNNLDGMDDDEKTQPVDKVEVDLALSAHANARRWYGMKKKQESKQEKTITAHEKAFKAAEKKTRLQLSQEKTVAAISHMRKVHWFEKFNWFISSENYLVISGRDAQQNEMIVKRYMSKGDLDPWPFYSMQYSSVSFPSILNPKLHGASSTVIKNHNPEHPVPPLTLNQAGSFTVCHSQAWNSKIVTSAWWVYPHQVSKTAPTGEYLTVGSFMIRGKKNFLPPHPLIMGFGILFRLDESSLGSHLNERRVRGEDEGVDDSEESVPFKEISDSESDKEALDENEETAVVRTPQLEDLIDRALELGSTSGSAKHYGLQTFQGDIGENNRDENKATQREKPCISKAERRKLKKGEKLEQGKEEVEENNKPSQPEKSVQSSRPGAGGKTSRGQRGKLKKMKEKYADQDEEERNIRMALLASAGRIPKKIVSQNEEAATSKGPKAVSGHDDAPKVCYKCKKAGHLSRDCQQHRDETVLGHSNGGPENNSHASLDNADNEIDRIAMEEDDIHEIGEEEKEKLNDVDFLTGIPLPNDILLYAVPVCGSYSALQSYKYRVKIIPGTAKRGKGAKMAMNLFSHMSEATQREKELMKACTDPELVAAIIGNVKVSAAGLTQLKQKQKKGKKANKG
ncbi:hypothetical protein RJ639_018858, partial [Escallonia herrerae]